MGDLGNDDQRPQSELLDLDRLTALEARLLEHEKAEIAARPQAGLALVLMIAGAVFALAALAVAPPAMLVLSAACLLVLVGMNRRKLAVVNGVTIFAAALVVFVFVPALDEMNRRTEEAANTMVQTMVSGTSSDFVFDPAYVLPEDFELFPTPVVIDTDFDDNGASLPE